MRRFAHGRLGVAWLLAGACGSRGAAGPGDASPDVAMPDASADAVPWPDVPSGMVMVWEQRDPAWDPRFGHDVFFPFGPGPVSSQDLPPAGDVGGCTIYPAWKQQCPDLCDSMPPRNSVCREGECIGLRSAGAITLGGTVLGTIVFEPDADAQYFSDLKDYQQPQVFNLGDVLTIVAEGDAHPGFSANLVTPGEVEETTPRLSNFKEDGAWPQVSRSEGFTVSWVPILLDQRVRIALFGPVSALDCDIADEGSFPVTREMIEASGASMAGDLIVVAVMRISETTAPTPVGFVHVVASTRINGVLELAP